MWPKVNHQRLKHVGLQLGVDMSNIQVSLEPATIGQLTSGGNPYQSCHRMAWPSPFGQRRMLYNPRCHHRIPQATLGLTHASQGVLRKNMPKSHISMLQFLPSLKRMGFLATEMVKITTEVFRRLLIFLLTNYVLSEWELMDVLKAFKPIPKPVYTSQYDEEINNIISLLLDKVEKGRNHE